MSYKEILLIRFSFTIKKFTTSSLQKNFKRIFCFLLIFQFDSSEKLFRTVAHNSHMFTKKSFTFKKHFLTNKKRFLIKKVKSHKEKRTLHINKTRGKFSRQKAHGKFTQQIATAK